MGVFHLGQNTLIGRPVAPLVVKTVEELELGIVSKQTKIWKTEKGSKRKLKHAIETHVVSF